MDVDVTPLRPAESQHSRRFSPTLNLAKTGEGRGSCSLTNRPIKSRLPVFCGLALKEYKLAPGARFARAFAGPKPAVLLLDDPEMKMVGLAGCAPAISPSQAERVHSYATARKKWSSAAVSRRAFPACHAGVVTCSLADEDGSDAWCRPKTFCFKGSCAAPLHYVGMKWSEWLDLHQLNLPSEGSRRLYGTTLWLICIGAGRTEAILLQRIRWASFSPRRISLLRHG